MTTASRLTSGPHQRPDHQRVIGTSEGDTHLPADVRGHGNVVARVFVGPRRDAYPYDREPQGRVGRVVAMVWMALD
ncbi:MAG: hypothetical protein M3T56_13675 [Chloroflexota bacterium]|nr:hypothetical protein [Chloroflexota bacterium]